jgi:hypothetical protein
MIRVRTKDLALVAFAGGLLAFELVSLGEALPFAKQALEAHGLLARPPAAAVAHAAPVSAALTKARVAASVAPAAEALGAARAEAPRAAGGERHVVVTRTASVSREAGGLRIVTVTGDGSCAAHVVLPSLEQLREIETVVDQALKQASL